MSGVRHTMVLLFPQRENNAQVQRKNNAQVQQRHRERERGGGGNLAWGRSAADSIMAEIVLKFRKYALGPELCARGKKKNIFYNISGYEIPVLC